MKCATARHLHVIVHAPITRVLAGTAIAVAALLTAAVLVWRFGFDSAYWTLPLPPLPGHRGFAALALYDWLSPLLRIAAVILLVVAVVRRRAPRAILPLVVMAFVIATYWPLSVATARRVDRLQGEVEEPIVALHALFAMVVVTMLLCAIHLLLTRAQATAVATSAIAIALLLHLFWFLLLLPIVNRWMPLSWDRADPARAVPSVPRRDALARRRPRAVRPHRRSLVARRRSAEARADDGGGVGERRVARRVLLARCVRGRAAARAERRSARRRLRRHRPRRPRDAGAMAPPRPRRVNSRA
jgi:hypothetical protein